MFEFLKSLINLNTKLLISTYLLSDFHSGPVVETLASIARGVSLIPDQDAMIPCTSKPKNQNIKQKQFVINPIKTLKSIHISKIFKIKNFQKRNLVVTNPIP